MGLTFQCNFIWNLFKKNHTIFVSTACQEKRTDVETTRSTKQGAGGEKKTV